MSILCLLSEDLRALSKKYWCKATFLDKYNVIRTFNDLPPHIDVQYTVAAAQYVVPLNHLHCHKPGQSTLPW
jgi:hypothetical protein